MAVSKGVFKSIVNITKAQIVQAGKDIKTNATNVAEEDYGIKLKLMKPSVKKIIADLKSWNEKRKEDKRLSREEMKSLVTEALKQTKEAIVDPASASQTSEFEELDDYLSDFGDELGDDLLGDDGDWGEFDLGNESDDFNRNSEESCKFDSPTPDGIAYLTLGILMSVQDERFKNFMISNMDHIKEVLGVVEYSDSDSTINTAVQEELQDIENEAPTEVMDELIEEVEDTKATSNLNLSINRAEISSNVGTESDNLVDDLKSQCVAMLHMHQRNENFSLAMDRVMTLLNRVVSLFEDDENGVGLGILSKNPVIYQIIDVFGFNLLDAVSFFSIFALMQSGQEPCDHIKAIEQNILELNRQLDNIQEINDN